MKMLSLITHPHVVPNPPDLYSSPEHKLRYFCWNLRDFWPCIDSNVSTKAQKGRKDIIKIVHVTISVSILILWSYKNTFCMQRKPCLLFCGSLWYACNSMCSYIKINSYEFTKAALLRTSRSVDHKEAPRTSDTWAILLICLMAVDWAIYNRGWMPG